MGTRIGFALSILFVGFLLAGFFLGSGEYAVSGEDSESGSEMTLASPTVRGADSGSARQGQGTPVEDLPPPGTLGYREQTISFAGEVLGSWEPGGWWSGKTYTSMNRADPHLPLSDGGLLTVPEGSTLDFAYDGGDSSSRSGSVDVLVFEVEEGDMLQDVDTGGLEVWADLKGLSRPTVLPVHPPGTPGQYELEIAADPGPGVYVVSASVSVTEGAARYNFRVLVE